MAFSQEPSRTKAYDDDMRWRMVYQRCVLELAYKDIATNLGVDPSTVQRTAERFLATGSISKAEYPKGHDHPLQKLTQVDEFLILQLILDRPNLYLHELQKEIAQTTGTEVSVSTICNFLHKSGFSRKKLSVVALQRSEEIRAQYRLEVSIYKPEMMVFVDETGSDRRAAMRRFGYSLTGKPARSVSLLARGKHMTAIAAITQDGILGCKITDQSVDADLFQDFVDESLLLKLNPFNGINPMSVVVMDNCAIHHVDHVVKSLEDLGVVVLFLYTSL